MYKLDMHGKSSLLQPLFAMQLTETAFANIGGDKGRFNLMKLIDKDYEAAVRALFSALAPGKEFDENFVVVQCDEGYNVKKVYPPAVYALPEQKLLCIKWGMTPIMLDYAKPPVGVELGVEFTKLDFDEAVLTVELSEPEVFAQFRFIPASFEEADKFNTEKTLQLRASLKKGKPEAFEMLKAAKLDEEGKFVLGGGSNHRDLPLYDLREVPDGEFKVDRAYKANCNTKDGRSFVQYILVVEGPEYDGATQYKVWSLPGINNYLTAGGKVPFTFQAEKWDNGEGKSGVNCTIQGAFAETAGGLKLSLLS